MAIYSAKNEYRGVNAHLHSYFLAEGGWKSFHNNHIGDLAKRIAGLLPSGYTVDIEQSLQIEVDGFLERPEPDLTIYARGGRGDARADTPPDNGFAPALTLPIHETLLLDETRYASAVMIYRRESGGLGSPVTRLELLSPTNKRGRGRRLYAEKRELALRDGLPLIEVDYLHDSPPPARGIPHYRRDDPGAFPYVILVSDPRPSLRQGTTQVYGFRVDEPIPTLRIPLSGHESFDLDFGAVYDHTFASLPAYSQRVDYAQLPLEFAAYRADDQARIRERMRLVCEAHEDDQR